MCSADLIFLYHISAMQDWITFISIFSVSFIHPIINGFNLENEMDVTNVLYKIQKREAEEKKLLEEEEFGIPYSEVISLIQFNHLYVLNKI